MRFENDRMSRKRAFSVDVAFLFGIYQLITEFTPTNTTCEVLLFDFIAEIFRIFDFSLSFLSVISDKGPL